MWFFAMTRIPLAEVTAMSYLSPVYVTLGAAIFMGEKLAFRRIAAVAVALLGVVVILRPGFREVSTGHLAMLVTGFAFGISYLLAKTMVGRTNPTVVVAMLSLWVTLRWPPLRWPIGSRPRCMNSQCSLGCLFATQAITP